jgi:hypothetical protein
VKLTFTVCPKCGAEIATDATEGLCAPCLLEAGLRLEAEPVAKLNGPNQMDAPPRAAGRTSAETNAEARDSDIPASLGNYDYWRRSVAADRESYIAPDKEASIALLH